MNRFRLPALLLAALLPLAAPAANTVSLSFSIARGNIPTATWSAPWATSCTASGGWTGAKANTGTQALPSLTGTTTFVLSCSSGNDTTATLSWTAPTTNTDGSPLTDLAGYNIYSGASHATLAPTGKVSSPLTLTYQVTNEPPGVGYYSVTAVNTSGVESAQSVVVSKTFGGAGAAASASLTLNVPSSPALTISTP